MMNDVVSYLRRPRHLRGALEAEDEQVQHEAVVLHQEGGELQPAVLDVCVVCYRLWLVGGCQWGGVGGGWVGGWVGGTRLCVIVCVWGLID